MLMKKDTFLTIFHMDMNHVCLREEYIREWLDRLAAMGYNAVLWELEDKVRWETCRDAVWPEAMTQSQFRSILDYSRRIGLEPIPLLQTVGHAEYVLKHPSYAHLRELPDRYDCYCTSNPDVRDFLKALIEEYLDLFGELKHFHLGGDEAYVFASCPKCKTLAEQTSPNKVYADHIMEIAKPILDRRIKPGIWCDMVLHYPGDIEHIPDELTIWDWNYWDGTDEPNVTRIWGEHRFVPKEQIGEETKKTMPEIMDADGKLRGFYTADLLRRLGYDVFVCSATRSCGDSVFCGGHRKHAGNVVGAARKAISSQSLGHCVTSWAVRIFNLELQEILISLATFCNRNPEASYEDIVAAAGQDLLGISPTELYQAVENIAAPIPLTVSGPFSGVQWSGLKDSLPAPPGHLKNIFDQWKQKNHGEEFTRKFEELKHSSARIRQGDALLKQLAGQVTHPPGREFVEEWFTAAKFQTRMANLLEQAFLRYENGASESDEECLSQAKRLREEYEDWARQWMTPKSATLNSELIFNPVLEYFSTPS
ncbi:MAG: family 20 glycosylhydrolase [Phycisphaerae bacterium]|nr:family 20 glycosylhydrolase [Phycisphaerae bacterium]